MAFVDRGTHANISRITYPSTGHLLFSTSKLNSILNVFMAWGLMRLGHSTAGWIHKGLFFCLIRAIRGQQGVRITSVDKSLFPKNYAHPIQVNEKNKNLCTFLHTTFIPQRDTVQTTSSNGGVTKN